MNTKKPLIATFILLAVALSLFPLASCQTGDNMTIGDGFGGDVLPTPVPTANPHVSSIGNNLLTNLGLFAILPVVIGATTFFFALKAFGNGDDREAVVPAIVAAVVAVVMIEVVVGVAAVIVGAMQTYAILALIGVV